MCPTWGLVRANRVGKMPVKGDFLDIGVVVAKVLIFAKYVSAFEAFM